MRRAPSTAAKTNRNTHRPREAEMNLQALRGVIPGIVTPFDPDGGVDLPATATLTRWLVDSGVHAIMTTGATGEFPHLDRSERRELTRAVVQEAGGKVPVIAGTAACSTCEALLLCEDAASVGADAVISVPPFYFPLPEAAIAAFFRSLADASPLPVFVYNNPLYTGNAMSPALIADALSHDNVVGLKQSSSDLGELVEVIHEVRVVRGLSRALFTGIDSQFAAAVSIGADGIFSTAAGIIPAAVVRLYSLAAGSDPGAASRVPPRLRPLDPVPANHPRHV